MKSISKQRHFELVNLRRKGMSIPEISRMTGISKTTVQRYVKDIQIPDILRKRLREKQGGAKERAVGLRSNCLEEAKTMLGNLSERDYRLLLIGLYWGEGTKRDFSIINSDPSLLQTVMHSLRVIGIESHRINLSLRVHSDIFVQTAIMFWARALGMPEDSIKRVEIVYGKKRGKLTYGMCRIRVCSGIRDRLLIQSAITLIGKEASEKVLSP